jgi:hypothetical protein
VTTTPVPLSGDPPTPEGQVNLFGVTSMVMAEPYARLRQAFVYKEKPSRTPLHLARHQTQPQGPRPARHLAQAGAALIS